MQEVLVDARDWLQMSLICKECLHMQGMFVYAGGAYAGDACT